MALHFVLASDPVKAQDWLLDIANEPGMSHAGGYAEQVFQGLSPRLGVGCVCVVLVA